MYLTAQRVHSPATGNEGINAFSYVHGPYTWQGLPPQGIPDQNPGELVVETVMVAPPGNRVRSYLDVVAPDETPWTEIRPAFMAFVSDAQRRPFPWVGIVGRCLFRLGMERGLAQRWQREIADLYRAAQAVRGGG
jgi:hypothetical protein